MSGKRSASFAPFAVVLGGTLLCAGANGADEDFFLDPAALDAITESAQEETVEENKLFDLGGSISQRLGYSFQHDNQLPKISLFKTELILDATLTPPPI